MSKDDKIFMLAEKLQALAHEFGYEVFRDSVAEACFRASDDTEEFDDKTLTQKYRYLANCVVEAEENEPVFSISYIED